MEDEGRDGFVGVDWASQTHRVAVIDAEGRELGGRGGLDRRPRRFRAGFGRTLASPQPVQPDTMLAPGRRVKPDAFGPQGNRVNEGGDNRLRV